MLSYLKIREIGTGKIRVDEEYLLSLGITVSFESMAYEVKGFTIPYGSWYSVKINSSIPDDQKWNAFLHELVHIVRNDCFDDKSARIAESRNPY